MDRIAKELGKLTEKERGKLKNILGRIQQGKFLGLDLKKLRGREDVFRARKGSMRIIFRVLGNGDVFILAVERRAEKTYR
ncbi:MAG: type II toxin-antitoxin system RelE/ParE family toxin [Patescibacteria group bacterium]